MPRHVASLLTLLFALNCASAAPGPKDKALKPYHPTRLGTALVYDDGGRDRTREVTAVEEKAGETLVTMSEVSTDGKVPLGKVSVSARGVFQMEPAESKADPVCILRFPVTEGDTWDFNKAPQPGLTGHGGTMTVGRAENVETPAGTFKAVRVDMVVRTQNGARLDPPQVYVQWFDPDLGLIKLSAPNGFTRVLKAVTRPGK